MGSARGSLRDVGYSPRGGELRGDGRGIFGGDRWVVAVELEATETDGETSLAGCLVRTGVWADSCNGTDSL